MLKDAVLGAVYVNRGRSFQPGQTAQGDDRNRANPLADYFYQNETGPGIWKWEHYFDIYHRHLQKFRGKPVSILEIGIFSGGSLGMWLDYFGSHATVHGIDIEPDCRSYETDRIKVTIGDQSDRGFWREFLRTNEGFDVVIDDGSHMHRDQIISLEEIFPGLNPGGIYICEDVHGSANRFASYVMGMASELNGISNPIQQTVECISFHPFITVIEKRGVQMGAPSLEKRGTEWQPPEFGSRSTRPKSYTA